jgi:hypothetical protein
MRGVQKRLKQTAVSVSVLSIALLLFALMLDPVGTISGSQDYDSYIEVRDYLNSTENANALYFASDGDFNQFLSHNEALREFPLDFIQSFYSELKSVASFGDWYFNKFLNKNSISHLVVPAQSARELKLEHKWGKTGSVEISLSEPFFEKILTTGGNLPIALFKVSTTSKTELSTTTYEFVWDPSVRESLYSPIVQQIEDGQYNYELSSTYLDGSDISWVYDTSDGQSEPVLFHITSPEASKGVFRVEIQLRAAYGSNAPSQVVVIRTKDHVSTNIVSASKSQNVSFLIASDENIEVSSALPCQFAMNFDPNAKQNQKFCFGISKILVRPVP